MNPSPTPRSRMRLLSAAAAAALTVLAPALLGTFLACSDNPGTYENWPRPVTAVALNKTTLNLSPGGAPSTLVATITPTDATNPALTWTSSTPSVATVAAGVVTPLAQGTTTITATSVDTGKFATCAVTVAPIAVTGVALNRTTLSMVAGDPATTLVPTVSPADATDKSVTWASTDSGVASVLNGAVTPVAPGTATITVTTVDGSKTATCAVTVSSRIIPVTGVVLDKTTATLGLGGTTTLVATVAPADATNANVTWTTNDPGVATVAGGVVTAVALGTTTITATTEDGSFTATCDVTVAPTFFGFTSTGVVFQKLGVDGDWSQVNAGTSGAALGLVISNNGNDFYGITTAATNGAIWQMTGPAGTWASASTDTASGTMKAAFYDGTNFYGFTGSGRYNTKTGVAGTWAASNLGGTTGFAIAAVTFDGTTFLGFQADGSVWSNTPAQVVTANTWTSLSSETAGAVLVSVVPNGAGDFFAISADGQIYKKTGTAGTWGNVSTKVAGSALIAIVYK